MYSITLEVNQICNFSCDYCYLGKLSSKRMDFVTAYQAMEIAFLNAQRHPDHMVWIDFVGGETLLSYEFIRKVSDWIDLEAQKRNLEVKYSITTNGSIINQDILEWLIRKKVQVKISIDGGKEVQDKNRKYCDGSGTHDKIIDNIAQFHEYENRTKMRMQATHVVTRNNYEDLYNSVKYLVEDLEMQVIDSALDLSVEWNYEQLDFIAKEWEKVIEYNLMRIHKGKPFMWGLIIDMQQYFAPSVCKGCGVGAIRIYVRTDGSIYGCASNLTETGYLGDVKGGLIIHKVKHYLDNEQECLKCNQCIFKRNCLAKICWMNRTRQENGDEIPNWVMCYLEEKKQTLWNKYKEYIRILV